MRPHGFSVSKLSGKSGIWNIISPNNFWSLHLGWALSGRQCAHQAVFLNQCLIFSFIPTAANQRPLNWIVANQKPPLNISIKSETAKKCLLVFPCLRQGPGQAPSVQISILIWGERALGRHREQRHKYQLDNVSDSLLQFSRVMAQIQCDTYFTHPLKSFRPLTSFQKLVGSFIIHLNGTRHSFIPLDIWNKWAKGQLMSWLWLET